MQGEKQVAYVLRASANVDPPHEHGRRPLPRSSRALDTEMPAEQPDSLREYLGVVRRHKLVVLACAFVTSLAALVYSIAQDPLYQASAAVLITSGGGAGSILSDIPGLAPTNDPERLAATNVNLARLPIVARQTIKSAGLEESAVAFLGRSSVSAETDADILRFSVNDLNRGEATRLATIYARQFALYRNGLDLQAIRSTRATINRTLARVAQQGQSASALYSELTAAVRRLDAAEAVHGSAAVFIQPATSAPQVRPRTKRNVALGLVVGLLYGFALAFLIERLDTRVRTPAQIEAVVGLPSLGELPMPPDLSKYRRRVAMLYLPHGPYAESVRKLRANLEFASVDGGPRSLMVTSAVPGEGKTTVAADLAVAFARSGKNVALCSLDAHAPGLDRSLGLDTRPGLVDVVLGHESLDRALVSISWSTHPGIEPAVTLAAASERHAVGDVIINPSKGPVQEGRLNVLPFGSRKPHDPGDFVGSTSVRQLVDELAETHDLVIVDTAPLLPVSDARVVSEYVDSALIVCGLKMTRKQNLRSVRRLVSVLPTRVFGVVVTGVPPMSGYGAYSGQEWGEVSARRTT